MAIKPVLVQSPAESPFAVTKRLRRQYYAALKSITREIERIAASVPLDQRALPGSLEEIRARLWRYSAQLGPWADAQAQMIVASLDRMNRRAWQAHSRNLSKGMRQRIQSADIQDVLARYKMEQAGYIAHLPLDAAEWVEALHQDVLLKGGRAADVARELRDLGQVSQSKAMLIARTEVARTANGLTKARALSIGAETYIWRTARDGDVRPEHREMEGVPVRYDAPPLFRSGRKTHRYHAGEFPNCRCYQEPMVPDRYF